MLRLCSTFLLVAVSELAHFPWGALIGDSAWRADHVHGVDSHAKLSVNRSVVSSLSNGSLVLSRSNRTRASRKTHLEDDEDEGEDDDEPSADYDGEAEEDDDEDLPDSGKMKRLPARGLLESDDAEEEEDADEEEEDLEEASFHKVYSGAYSQDYDSHHDYDAPKKVVPDDYGESLLSEHDDASDHDHAHYTYHYYDHPVITSVVEHVHEAWDCHDGLEHWELEWADEKKLWCCAHENLGCLSDHFDCQDGLLNWEKEWSQLKMEWCCHTKNLGCSKCDDYECPPDHKKLVGALSGSIKCHLPPCKNSECCEMWGNMELRRLPTPGPTPLPHTHPPTPIPTSAPTPVDAFHCGSSMLDSMLGWSQAKQEWCCANRNMGCKDVHPAEVQHADGRRRMVR